MAQPRGIFPQLYDNIDKTISAILRDTLRELPPIYKQVFNTETSDRKFERRVSKAMFTDTPLKGEGEDYTTQLIDQGYTKDFTHTENGLGFEVTQTALEDDAENLLSRSGDWLAFSARYVEEGRAAGVPRAAGEGGRARGRNRARSLHGQRKHRDCVHSDGAQVRRD